MPFWQKLMADGLLAVGRDRRAEQRLRYYIHVIRRQLDAEQSEHPRFYIVTEHGLGYRLVRR
jgi:DNA-binding response OmpR family regulator